MGYKIIAFLFLTCSLTASTFAAEDFILIGAENFSKADSEHEDFARPRADSADSGRKVLARIFNPGALEYDFDVPAGGEYTSWLRYTRKTEKDHRCAAR